MELSLHDLNFCIQLMMDFSFACNHEDETMLSDFLEEQYGMANEAWHNELTGGTDSSGNESQPWNGATIALRINDKVTLYTEYHPFETIYFFNDTYLGNTGGHFHLSLLSWNEFLQIIQDREKETLLFFLLLPLVVGSKAELPFIKSETEKRLTELPFKQEHAATITKYLANHLVFEDDEDPMFSEDAKKGTVCKRNHSERNPEKDTQDLINVNVAVLTAMEK